MKGFFKKYFYETIIAIGIFAIVISSGFVLFMGEGVEESWAYDTSECTSIKSATSQRLCKACINQGKIWTGVETCVSKTATTSSTNKSTKCYTCDDGNRWTANPPSTKNCEANGLSQSKCTGSTSTTPSTNKSTKCYTCDDGNRWTANPPSTKNCEANGLSQSKCTSSTSTTTPTASQCKAGGYSLNPNCNGIERINEKAGCEEYSRCVDTETPNRTLCIENYAKICDTNETSTPAPAPCSSFFICKAKTTTPKATIPKEETPEITSEGSTVKTDPNICDGTQASIWDCYFPDDGTSRTNSYFSNVTEVSGNYETTPTISLSNKPTTSENKEIVAYFITTSPLLPKATDARWVPWSKDKTTATLDAGTYYVYAKDGSDNIFELDKLIINVEANNIISQLQLMINGSSTKTPIYYGKVLSVYGADQKSNYGTYAQNATYGTRLSVESSTGLVMYTLDASEKTALKINVDKIYVVATKDKTTVGRSGTNTFTINANGGITAVSHGVLGSIYQIEPKLANGSIPNKQFYAIRLDNIVTNNYSDPNSWNDMNLLHYSQYKYADYNNANSKTSELISGSSDFSFKVLRTGWTSIALGENHYSDTTIKLLSANRYSELAANTDGTIYIDTKSDVTQYEATVEASEVAVNPILVYTDSTFVDGYGPRTVKLSYGLNVIDIKVKSAKGSVRTYTFLITRPDNRSSDNTLSNLTVSGETITPTFNRFTNDYKLTVKNSVSKVSVGATTNNKGAEFLAGFGPRTVSLKVGENIVYVKVKSQTGTERVYKLTITRKAADKTPSTPVTPTPTPDTPTKSSNNKISEMYLSAGNLIFDPNVTEYNLYVTNDIKSVLLKVTLEDSKATYRINGPETLAVGSNKYTVDVTAENGDVKTYNFNIIRKELGLVVSTSKALKTLEIDGHRINFDPTNYLYKLTIKPKEKELTINAVADNARSDIVIEGNTELTSFSDIKVKVIAEDGSYVIYDINITVNRGNLLRDILIGCGYAVVLGLIVWAGYKKGKTMKK